MAEAGGACQAARRPLRDAEWARKKRAFVWRGSLTGGDYNDDILDFLVRPAMVKRASEMNAAYASAGARPPFDVGFVPYSKSRVPFSRNEDVGRSKAAFEKAYEFREPIASSAYSKYRYVLHADGHSASWGIAGKLASGSAIVWLESTNSFREHYYSLPLPTSTTCPPKSTWSTSKRTRAHLPHRRSPGDDAIAKRACVRARRFRLRSSDMWCYMYRVLAELSKRYDGSRPLNFEMKEHRDARRLREWKKPRAASSSAEKKVTKKGALRGPPLSSTFAACPQEAAPSPDWLQTAVSSGPRQLAEGLYSFSNACVPVQGPLAQHAIENGPTNDAGTVLLLRPDASDAPPWTIEQPSFEAAASKMRFSVKSSWDAREGSLWASPVHVAPPFRKSISALGGELSAYHSKKTLMLTAPTVLPGHQFWDALWTLLPAAIAAGAHSDPASLPFDRIFVPNDMGCERMWLCPILAHFFGGVVGVAQEAAPCVVERGESLPPRHERTPADHYHCFEELVVPQYSKYRAGKFRETSEMMSLLVDLRRVLVERMIASSVRAAKAARGRKKRLLIYPHLKGARARRWLDADDVCSELSNARDFPYEVRCVDDFAKLSIPEQGAEFYSADVIFATHGSQMSNVIFSEPGTHVFELLCSKNGYYLPFGPFKSAMGFEYSWIDGSGAGVHGAYDPHPVADDVELALR